MSSFSELSNYQSSLATATSETVLISAARGQELMGRSGNKRKLYALRLLTSQGDVYAEDWRAKHEVQRVQLTCFIETSDGLSEREIRYSELLEMRDNAVNWLIGLDNSSIGVNLTKYLGVVSIVDDQDGFYELRLNFEYEKSL